MANRMTKSKLNEFLPEKALDVRYPGNNTIAWTALVAGHWHTFTIFHGTVIADLWATRDGSRMARLDTGGWHTPTTRERMTAAIGYACGGYGHPGRGDIAFRRPYIKKGRIHLGPWPIVDGEIVTIMAASTWHSGRDVLQSYVPDLEPAST